MESLINTSVKNIIFDLGGVILNIDYGLTLQAFKQLGILDPESQFNQLKQTPLFDDFETGRISSNEFRAGLRSFIPRKVSDVQIDDAWNAMLLDLPQERLQLLTKLSGKFRLFLLSNTNEIHIAEFHRRLQKWFGFSDLSHLFEKVHYSYRMGQRKPDVEIFETVVRASGLLAEETLFIDDSPQHIEGARPLGLQTHFLKPDEEITDLLS